MATKIKLINGDDTITVRVRNNRVERYWKHGHHVEQFLDRADAREHADDYIETKIAVGYRPAEFLEGLISNRGSIKGMTYRVWNDVGPVSASM